jgi:hypothetical protein
MANIFLRDSGGGDHFLDFPMLPLSRTEFVEIENKLGALPSQVFFELIYLPPIQFRQNLPSCLFRIVFTIRADYLLESLDPFTIDRDNRVLIQNFP